jgi:UDP-N-acetyl-D-galactosamine dehydrogenase
VTVLGVTFKEDVPDTRNSKVIDMIRDLQSFGLTVSVHDPHADKAQVQEEYGITLTPYDELQPASAVICAVPHRKFLEEGWGLITSCLVDRSGIVFDIKSKLDASKRPDSVELWRL